MKNILLPTDYSESANNAFEYALHLTNKFAVKLYVLYAYTAPVLSSAHAGQPDLLSNVYHEIESAQKKTIERKNAKLLTEARDKKLKTDNIEFLFEHGSVLSAVHNVTTANDVSLIVMGVHGVSGFTSGFIGSNTVSVIRNLRFPVLAIPAQAKFSDISKIAFTTLFKEQDFAALKEIVDIASLVNAQVYCVHVNSDNSNPADTLLYAEKWIKQLETHQIEFVFLDKAQSVESTVNQYIIDNNIDVLAIVRRNRNFFDRLISSSLSSRLTFHSEIPIFVFHESK